MIGGRDRSHYSFTNRAELMFFIVGHKICYNKSLVSLCKRLKGDQNSKNMKTRLLFFVMISISFVLLPMNIRKILIRY